MVIDVSIAVPGDVVFRWNFVIGDATLGQHGTNANIAVVMVRRTPFMKGILTEARPIFHT